MPGCATPCKAANTGCLSMAATIVENLLSAAIVGSASAVRLFSPARVSFNQALLSSPAVWVLAGLALCGSYPVRRCGCRLVRW
jgi:hypothetical protein